MDGEHPVPQRGSSEIDIPQIPVLGVNFHQITQAEAQAQAKIWLEEGGFHPVVTPNPEFILAAQKNLAFGQVLNQAHLVLPDGIGVVYAARILGTPLPGRVPGIEFATGLMEQLNETGGRLFLLGAKDGVPQEAEARLSAKYPHLVVCGTHHGYFTDQENQQVAEKIKASQPDVVFICLGAPRQEMFMAKYGPHTGAKIAVGLGGCLDVFAGRVERAPAIWQKLNLEFLYRLCKEPKRLGRMAKLPLVLWQALLVRVTGKFQGEPVAGQKNSKDSGDTH